MKRLLPACFAVLLPLAAAARAEEPPPPPGGEAKPAPAEKPPHSETKVSAAAKELVAAYEKGVYSAVRAGLKEAAGTIKMKMDMGDAGGAGGGQDMPEMGADFKVTFKAPHAIAVKASGGEAFGPGMAQGMAEGVKGIVRSSLGIVDLDAMFESAETYEADVRTADGRKVLVATFYEKGAEVGRMEMTLDDRSLPSSAVLTATVPGPGGTPTVQKTNMEFTFAKHGDLHELEKWKVVTPMAPGPIVYAVKYAEGGGFRVAASFTMEIQGMGMKFDHRWTELTLNGKKVELESPKVATAPSEGAAPKKGDDGEDGDGMDDEGDDDDDGGDEDEDEDEDGMR